MSEEDSPDWIDLTGLSEDDPMRAAALNHLETSEDIELAHIEQAVRNQTLQLIQNLYDAAHSGGGNPRLILKRMGVDDVLTEEEQEAVEEAKEDAPSAAPNDG